MMVIVAALFVAVDNSELGFDEKLFQGQVLWPVIAGISAEAGQLQ